MRKRRKSDGVYGPKVKLSWGKCSSDLRTQYDTGGKGRGSPEQENDDGGAVVEQWTCVLSNERERRKGNGDEESLGGKAWLIKPCGEEKGRWGCDGDAA